MRGGATGALGDRGRRDSGFAVGLELTVSEPAHNEVMLGLVARDEAIGAEVLIEPSAPEEARQAR